MHETVSETPLGGRLYYGGFEDTSLHSSALTYRVIDVHERAIDYSAETAGQRVSE